MDSRDTKKLEQGVVSLREGDYSRIRAILGSVADSPEARLLALQADMLEGESDASRILEALERQTENSPAYAAAWCSLSHHAENMSDQRSLALKAAARCGKLWPKGPDASRVATLRSRWIDTPLEKARTAFEEGRLEESLSLLENLPELDERKYEVEFLKGRVFLAMGRIADAEAALALIPEDDQSTMLRAEIAMKGKRWQDAVDLLDSIPENTPGRESAFRRANLMWRLSILPGFVQEAAEKKELSREDVAVLLVAMAPDLESLPGTAIPLVGDIIDRPAQRFILTVLRLGLIGLDPVSHQYLPERIITPGELRSAVDGVCELLGYTSPLWCPDDTGEMEGCRQAARSRSGQALVDIMLDLEKAGA